MIGRAGPPRGCASEGWLPSRIADAVASAIARAAGLARPALLGLSRTIRIPDPATSPQTRDPGDWGQRAANHSARRDKLSKSRRLRREQGSHLTRGATILACNVLPAGGFKAGRLCGLDRLRNLQT